MSEGLLRVRVHRETETRTRKEPRTPWATSEEKELVGLFRKGVDVDVLAERFHKSPAAVKKKLMRLGLDVADTKLDLTDILYPPKDLLSLEVANISAAVTFKPY